MSPAGATEWLPLWQAAGFFIATFILEDAAAIGAGLLLAAGQISWPAAFTACFLGIWLGDVGLYSLARFAGRAWFERSSLKKSSTKVARSEKWFGERGALILIFSRAVPGARLPTYLAAGFLRVPLPRFLFVTGVAAFGWTFIILLLAQTFGAQVARWLSHYKSAGFILLGAGIILLATFQLARRAFTNFDSRIFSAWIGRWTHWEFWPMWLFYPPVAIYYLWLAIKCRGALLPTAANPGIFSGGMVGESKMQTLRELMQTSPQFTAEAELIVGATTEERLVSLRETCARRRIFYPFILKPDLGQRGAGIKLIRDESQALAYLQQTSAALLVQRYADGPHEAGIFYYRFPGEPRGRIFSITEKIFPVIIGDGKSTMAELVWNDARARFMAEKYLQRFGARQNEVLAEGKTQSLVQAGNHAQGCIFRDGMRLNSPALESCIDEISKKVSGFFIGRYDIRFASEADLRAGKKFSIIELNGAAAEATSIYDARNSLWSAYRTLFRQWDLVFAIGAENRRRGCAPMKISDCWCVWRNYSALAATYPAAD
ncbi:MAG: VTT domain-containing protein [Verrucomicrobiae bacterium]|nr:VTT domain-containing protein [Verrucomicrobiae bacterium]